MSTLLDKTSLPLWVFIVIIVVGSLCLLGTAGFLIRCVIVRKRAGAVVTDQDDEFAAPMRKMTVRRGRVVPQSHYLSLTGSKFGLNEFENEAVTSRSKSPFEWWNKNKRQSQQEMSQRGSMYGRSEFARSTSALGMNTTPEKKPPISTNEIHRSSPSPTALPSPPPVSTPSPTASPSRSHFSRPFHSTIPGSPFIKEKRLSMIEEASPHTSMISTQSRRRSSKMSLTPTTDGNLTRYEPRRGSASQRLSSNTPTTSTHSLPSQLSSYYQQQQRHDVLAPMAYRGSRSSLGDIEQPRPSLSPSHRSSTNSRHDSVHDSYEEHQSQRQRPIPRNPSMPSMAEEEGGSASQPHQGQRSQQYQRQSPLQQRLKQKALQPLGQQGQQQQRQRPTSGLWSNGPEQRNDKFPARTSSKKGRVLRKKSLRQGEMVSTMG